MNSELKQLCKTLRLAYVADIYESIPFENETQYLMDLLKKEIQLRDEAKGKRLIKKAKFLSIKTLKTFQWTEQIHFPAHIDINTLCSLDFIRNRENVVLIGAPGTGNYVKFLFMERQSFYSIIIRRK